METTPQPLPALEAGKGGLSGLVPDALVFWPSQPARIYAAAYYGGGDGSGFYMLDPDRDASAVLGTDGSFALGNIPPGMYLLVAGPTAEQSRRVVDADQQPALFPVNGGEWQDLGVLQLEP